VDIKPDTLNLKSKGEWVTVYAHIETGYDEKDIVVESVMLDGIQVEWGKIQDDGRLMVKFSRASVIANLEGYEDGEGVTLTFSGRFVDGVRFTGEGTIKVVNHEG
jgi:hypothetical protein